MAGSRVKMAAGALLAVAGVWWYVPNAGLNGLLAGYSTLTNLQSLLVGLQGGLGIILALVGIFIVWIERDQIKLQRELERRENEEQQSGPGTQGSEASSTVPGGNEDEQEPDDDSTEEPEQEEEVECEDCERTFDSEHGLRVHRSHMHEE